MAGSTALLKTVFQNRFRTGLLVVLSASAARPTRLAPRVTKQQVQRHQVRRAR